MQLAGLLDPKRALRRSSRTRRQVGADASRLAHRAPLDQGADPRGVSQPRRVPRRAAGHRRGVAVDLFGKAPSGLDRRASPGCSRPDAPRRTPRSGAPRPCHALASRRARKSPATSSRRWRATARHAAAVAVGRAVDSRRNSRASCSREPGQRVVHHARSDAYPAPRARRARASARRVSTGATCATARCSCSTTRQVTVLAYVGSPGALARASASRRRGALRQAGSTLKPFLYGLAIERALPHARRRCSRTRPCTSKRPPVSYIPQNYDRDFLGTGERADGTRKLAQHSRGAHLDAGRRRNRSAIVSATGLRRPRPRCRVLRLLARTRFRRGESPAAGERVSSARERWAQDTAQLCTPHARGARCRSA